MLGLKTKQFPLAFSFSHTTGFYLTPKGKGARPLKKKVTNKHINNTRTLQQKENEGDQKLKTKTYQQQA